MTDIQIAQQAKMLPIREVVEKIGVSEDDIEMYGKYKAKFTEEFLQKLESKPNGKLVLVTAINPTPAGEGKTTISVGLGQALNKVGKKTIIALREPSLGPCLELRAGQQVEAMPKLFQWKISIYTLQEIFTPSHQQITCWLHCLTIIFSREMNCRLIPDKFYGKDASI